MKLKKSRFITAALLAQLVITPHTFAIEWAGGDGNFNSVTTPGWIGGEKPTAGTNSLVNNAAVITIDSDQAVNDMNAGIGGPGTSGTYLQTAGNVLFSSTGGWFRLGNGAGATGTYTITGGTATRVEGGGRMNIGEGNSGTGIINIGGTGVFTNLSGSPAVMSVGGGGLSNYIGTGVINISDTGRLNCNGEMWLGQDAGSVGTLNISGGILDQRSWLAVGRNSGAGTLNISGGSILFNAYQGAGFAIGAGGGGDAGTGVLNQTGGSIEANQTFYISQIMDGKMHMSGGTVAANGGVVMAEGTRPGHLVMQGSAGLTGSLPNGGGTGVFTTTTFRMGVGNGNCTVDLNGGTLAVNTFDTGIGTGSKTINFNGGVLKANALALSFLGGAGAISTKVLEGGAKIDNQGNVVILAGPLEHGGAGMDGGLMISGDGLVEMQAANTYNGPTTLSAGVMVLNSANSLSDTAPLTIGANAEVSLLHEGTEVVGGLVLNGVPQPAGFYDASTSSPFLSGSGRIQVVPSGSPFSNWMAVNYPGISAPDNVANADPDGDGVTNLLEFALNGNPSTGANKGLCVPFIMESSAPVGKELTLVAAVRDGAVFNAGTATVDGITYTVEGSLNLVFPGSAVSSTGPSDTAPAGSGLPSLAGTPYEYHVFKLDVSEGLSGKGFLRMKVTAP